jgi:Tol biopolymer transport system component
MALDSGTRFGNYEILLAVGRGGMGEVYRARDTKLDRNVAVKVLPESFTADADRLARFEREAKVLASLNHPNIGAIYGVEEAAGVRALILELVEGPTLADRIAQGPIPLEEVIPIAKQIADAVESAHENGVIHRDLKPANIKVRPDGMVKVLDFGLARALESTPVESTLSQAATLTSPVATQMGVILGTAAYMSPEQARGKPVDKRTDIWAFGCVLFEMLTGKRAFAGDDVSDVLAHVLTQQPDFDALPPSAPVSLRKLVRRCLEKDPKQRLRDIGEARVALEAHPDVEMQPPAGTSLPREMVWIAAAAFVVLVGLVIAAPAGWRRNTNLTDPTVTRFAVPVPTGHHMQWGQLPSLAISPDGSRIVFETQGRLYMRMLDRFDAEPIPGAEGGIMPFFSPGGDWIGFARGGTLLKAPVQGGTPQKITDAVVGNGAAWGLDGRIVFSGALGNGGLWSVSAENGTPEQITKVSESENETGHYWPDILPDGALLYTAIGPSGHAQDARLVVEDPARKSRIVVAEGVTFGRYLAGHLLYADAEGTLMLQPFDLPGRKAIGPARAVLPGVRISTWGGGVSYAVSSNGTLAYVTGTEHHETILTELDITGKERRRLGMPQSLGFPAVSPDGRTLALTIRSVNNDDIYLMDVASGRFERFSFDVAEDETPVWSPDGKQIAYSAAAPGEQRRVFIKTVGSSEREKLVYTGKRHLHLTSWSQDDWLAFYEFHPRSTDISVLNLKDTTKLVPVATMPSGESNAVFSPDGKWLAYDSEESGRLEVYVVSFPDLAVKQQVSREGGFYPQWSSDDKELFFIGGAWDTPARMMHARRAADSGALAWESPERLFNIPNGYDFDVAPNGRSFYYVAPNPDAHAREIRIVVNWLKELLSNSSAAPK